MTKASRWRVAVVVVGLFMAILDTTIVSVTLPQMQQAFHTDFETITWVASAYFLAQAAIIPVVGYLSDRVGTKLIDLAALTLFTVGSALCTLAPTKEALIAFRVFQGIGGARCRWRSRSSFASSRRTSAGRPMRCLALKEFQSHQSGHPQRNFTPPKNKCKGKFRRECGNS